MNRNLLILLAEKLALFNQRALAGEALSQASREDWLRTYSRLIANLTARSEAPIVAMKNIPPALVNEQSRNRWPVCRSSRNTRSTLACDGDLHNTAGRAWQYLYVVLQHSALLSHQANKNADSFVEGR